MRPFLLIALCLTITAHTARAQLLDFDFSETVSGGTVTGEIKGLASSGTSTPTEIIIFTQPTGYPIGATSLISSGFGYNGTDNNFTVSGGNITAADVGIYKAVAGGYQGYAFNFTNAGLGFNNSNGVYETNASGAVTMSNSNTGGFTGITYTPVPEPRQTMALFLLAGLGLLAARKFRSRLSR